MVTLASNRRRKVTITITYYDNDPFKVFNQSSFIASSSYDPSAKVDDVYGIIGIIKLLAGL